jgi:hypothetical protein
MTTLESPCMCALQSHEREAQDDIHPSAAVLRNQLHCKLQPPVRSWEQGQQHSASALLLQHQITEAAAHRCLQRVDAPITGPGSQLSW